MSDTPRTDSAEPYGTPYNGEESGLIHVPKTFARQLERELNQANRMAVMAYELLEAIREKVGLSKFIDLGEGTGVSHFGYASFTEKCEKLKGGTK